MPFLTEIKKLNIQTFENNEIENNKEKILKELNNIMLIK